MVETPVGSVSSVPRERDKKVAKKKKNQSSCTNHQDFLMSFVPVMS